MCTPRMKPSKCEATITFYNNNTKCFSLKEARFVFRVDMITKLNLTLVRGKLDSFFLVDRMGTF